MTICGLPFNGNLKPLPMFDDDRNHHHQFMATKLTSSIIGWGLKVVSIVK